MIQHRTMKSEISLREEIEQRIMMEHPQVNSDEHAWRGERALVTGGAGFIGSHLVETLDRAGAEVVVLDNLQAGKWENLSSCSSSVQQVEGDIRDDGCVKSVLGENRPSIVFHLAANASVPGSVDEPVYDFESNCGGTFVLLNAIRATGLDSRIVVASSGAVYGEPTEFPVRETSSLAPISPYGASKLCAEVESRMLSDVYEMQVSIARIFNSYGPRMPRFVVFDFLKKLHNDPEHLEILGSGKQVRDFNYVKDTVQGLMVLALRGQKGQAYNVASGVSYSVTQVAHHLVDILGYHDVMVTYTGSSWIGDAQRWEVDISRLCNLGYVPRYTFKQGLMEVVQWFQRDRAAPTTAARANYGGRA